METSITKKEIVEKVGKKYFYYKQSGSQKRGYQIRVDLIGIDKKTKRPVYIAGGDFQSGTWRGAQGEAIHFLSKLFNVDQKDIGFMDTNKIIIFEV